MNPSNLEDYLIPDLARIIDNHLLANPGDHKYFYHKSFNKDELLKFIADNFNPKITREQFNQNILIEQVYLYLEKKGILS